jgi:hypothetical protein
MGQIFNQMQIWGALTIEVGVLAAPREDMAKNTAGFMSSALEVFKAYGVEVTAAGITRMPLGFSDIACHVQHLCSTGQLEIDEDVFAFDKYFSSNESQSFPHSRNLRPAFESIDEFVRQQKGQTLIKGSTKSSYETWKDVMEERFCSAGMIGINSNGNAPKESTTFLSVLKMVLRDPQTIVCFYRLFDTIEPLCLQGPQALSTQRVQNIHWLHHYIYKGVENASVNYFNIKICMEEWLITKYLRKKEECTDEHKTLVVENQQFCKETGLPGNKYKCVRFGHVTGYAEALRKGKGKTSLLGIQSGKQVSSTRHAFQSQTTIDIIEFINEFGYNPLLPCQVPGSGDPNHPLNVHLT